MRPFGDGVLRGGGGSRRANTGLRQLRRRPRLVVGDRRERQHVLQHVDVVVLGGLGVLGPDFVAVDQPLRLYIMACTVMAYVVVAYVVVAYIVMASGSYGLCSYGQCSYGLCSYGQCSHGLCSHGLYSHRIYIGAVSVFAYVRVPEYAHACMHVHAYASLYIGIADVARVWACRYSK